MMTSNTATVQMNAVQNAIQAAALAGQTQQTGGDGFSQLLMQLLGGATMNTGQNGGLSSDDTLFQLAAGLADTEDADGQPTAEAMQMAAYLAQGSALSAFMAAETAQPDLMQQNPVLAVVVQNPALATELLRQVQSGQMLISATEAPPQMPQEQASFAETVQTAAKQPETAAMADAAVSIVGAKSGGEVKSTSAYHNEDPLAGEIEFSRSVAEAQKALETVKRKGGAEETAGLDIETLQHNADVNRTGTAKPAAAQPQALPTKEELAAQVKEPLLKNLADGNNEFEVRLKPESLGEITVKMQEKDGKITLTILTQNPQTAKLLNESADMLRNSLRPLQAEIREIIPRPEPPSQTQQGSFTGSFESFQQHQSARQEQPAYYTEADNSADSLFGETEPQAVMAAGGIDTYI